MEPLEAMREAIRMHDLNFYGMSRICHVCNDSGLRWVWRGEIGRDQVTCECVEDRKK